MFRLSLLFNKFFLLFQPLIVSQQFLDVRFADSRPQAPTQILGLGQGILDTKKRRENRNVLKLE